MTDKIKVVKPYYAKEEAYMMGFNRFKGMDSLGKDETFDLSGFTSSAEYANVTLPKLRAMSGFSDRGHGTFTDNGQVAAIKPGCEEDTPADAELTEAVYVFEELTEYWTHGAYDAAMGEDPDVNRH